MAAATVVLNRPFARNNLYTGARIVSETAKQISPINEKPISVIDHRAKDASITFLKGFTLGYVIVLSTLGSESLSSPYVHVGASLVGSVFGMINSTRHLFIEKKQIEKDNDAFFKGALQTTFIPYMVSGLFLESALIGSIGGMINMIKERSYNHRS